MHLPHLCSGTLPTHLACVHDSAVACWLCLHLRGPLGALVFTLHAMQLQKHSAIFSQNFNAGQSSDRLPACPASNPPTLPTVHARSPVYPAPYPAPRICITLGCIHTLPLIPYITLPASPPSPPELLTQPARYHAPHPARPLSHAPGSLPMPCRWQKSSSRCWRT
jgi:hypothetical protein